MSTLQIITTDSDHIVATWRNVFVNMWRRRTLPHAVIALKPVILQLGTIHPGGIGMLTILEPDAQMASPEAREELPKLFKAVSKHVVCSGLVFEGVGFRAAAIRAVTTTFNMMAAQPFPHKVLSNVQEAEQFFIQLLPPSARGEQLARGDLASAISELRARFDLWCAGVGATP